MPKHINGIICEKCLEIMYLYPAPHPIIIKWFKALKEKYHNVHCSWVGRGEVSQEMAYKNKASAARYGESPHNYNAAIDLFQIDENGKPFWSDAFMTLIFKNDMASNLFWGGLFTDKRGKPKPDNCHFEIKNWKDLLKNKEIKLVE